VIGPYPEMNDFNAVLTGVPLAGGPVLLEGMAPKCRYFSFQLFLPGSKTNSPKQCLRDRQMEIVNGKYAIILSTLSEKPKWANDKNWIEVPEGSKRCILCLRTYCPEVGVGFQAPNVWYGCRQAVKDSLNINAALHKAGKPEDIGNRDRVMGMLPAQIGEGATHQRLYQAIVFNAILLILCGQFTSTSKPFITYLLGYNPVNHVNFVLPLAAAYGLALYNLAFKYVERIYRLNIVSKKLKVNSDVLVPDPKGDLKGHPNHLYYTIHYDASKNKDVKIQGFKNCKGFTYTSVTCYGWSSLPPANGQFRYDETLVSDNNPALSKNKKDEDGEPFTVYITTKPTFKVGCNEIDVSQEPSGVCLIRLIYPDSAEVVKRCTPVVKEVTMGER
jgi:hypothetical protein